MRLRAGTLLTWMGAAAVKAAAEQRKAVWKRDWVRGRGKTRRSHVKMHRRAEERGRQGAPQIWVRWIRGDEVSGLQRARLLRTARRSLLRSKGQTGSMEAGGG